MGGSVGVTFPGTNPPRAVWLLIAMCAPAVYATHQRAGHIVYRHVSGYTYEITIYMWMYSGSPVSNQRPEMEVYFGDGTRDSLATVGGPSLDPVTATVLRVYQGVHTFPGPYFYNISTEDPNRDSGIVNIPNSVNIPIYLESGLGIFDPQIIGPNNSPVMLEPGVVVAEVGQPFFYMPVAYDPDGDSLAFRLVSPLTTAGVPVPGYQYPDQVSPAPDVFTVQSQTGLVSWVSPQIPGHYNFAVEIREFRNGILVGKVLRDVRVIVRQTGNQAPRITQVLDTCVWAGDTVRFRLHAWDPDLNPIQVNVTGSAFQHSQNPPVVDIVYPTPDSAVVEILWVPPCEDIREAPYQFIVWVRDSTALSRLSTFEVWNVQVVGPPDTPVLTVQGTSIQLDWGPGYRCASAPHFLGFAVWRKIGTSPPAGPCFRDPPSLGYSLRVSPWSAYTYVDALLSPGNLYCYRLTALFGEWKGVVLDTLRGVVSPEVCDTIPWLVPLLINASVRQTDTVRGSVFVRWMRPRDLDTTQWVPPYRVEVYRGQGFQPSSWQIIKTGIYGSFASMIDTFLVDSPLNTAMYPWAYRIRFYVEDTVWMGETPSASTPYLVLQPQDRRMVLSWSANVPWQNFAYAIFRKGPQDPVFLPLDTVSVPYYVDTGLQNGKVYCYRIFPAWGRYMLPGYGDTLANHSQVACASPADQVPPCPPELIVEDPCERVDTGGAGLSGDFLAPRGYLILDPACAYDVERVVFLFRPSSELPWVPVETLALNEVPVPYLFPVGSSITGCYSAVLIDSSGNASAPADSVCLEDCPFYRLPSAFSPNGDGIEDIFHPILPYWFVSRVDFQVVDRWGRLLFRTEDPWIGWDGTDLQGNPVPEGVYYYVCRIYVRTLEGIQEWQPALQGTIVLQR